MADEQLPEWARNITDPSLAEKLKKLSTGKKKLPPPPGYKERKAAGSGVKTTNSAATSVSINNINTLQVQKAWQIAFAPAKSIPMNFFMSYMSGTSLQIIPIMTALMLLSGPIKAIFGITNEFRPVLGNKATESQVRLAMFAYVLGQCLLMFIGIRKLNQMGLIPNTTSDWLPWERAVDFNNGIKSYVF